MQRYVYYACTVPLAMAPPNEEDYCKKEIKSDLRFEKLFPKKFEKVKRERY